MAKKIAGGVYRLTVSIPNDLRERMVALGDGVNWSAVASAAFEDKLVKEASKKKERDMSDVAARLKASRRKAMEARSDDGKGWGRAWVEASDGAEFAELERLEKFWDGLRDRDDFFTDHDGAGASAYTVGEQIHHIISREDEGDRIRRDEAAYFWMARVGERHPNTATVEGFCIGALEAFDEAKKQM